MQLEAKVGETGSAAGARAPCMDRYICIHGHFYQPPRENPWLEAIELQDSAAPYHDWNERITAECYAPNACSRILDGEGRIVQIVNNYAGISFDFGPTLLSWLEENAPETYEAILAADRESQRRFSGHGSAMAQAYNHLILPLANRRDKYTQVLWGIRDFEHRFARSPEGMWLPETAADLETLDILAECGIRFTLLAPNQARQVRPLRGRAWRDVSGSRIDPSTPYLLRLPSGRTITVFFYDGPISRALAFENLLCRGESLAGRLAGAFNPARTWPQVVHIATDGETYGHHRPLGDMGLAYALHYIEANHLARLTNYGEYLERHPPAYEVQIVENSSWSCAHGVERWRSDCGCNSGAHRGWSQQWRAPLREAFDWLRDRMASLYEEIGRKLFADPWAARSDYINVMLDRSPQALDSFFDRHCPRQLEPCERVSALRLLELQRHAMLMYTSCGWFFDELSGIETVQVIQYAGRVLQLAQCLGAPSLEEEFLAKLALARSNLPEHGDGRRIFEKFVRPAMVNLQSVGAHYAISSLFEAYGERTKTFCYVVDREDYKLLRSGKTTLALGRARITSEIIHETTVVSFGVLHLGDHNIFGGVRQCRGEAAYRQLVEEIADIFNGNDFARLVHSVDKNFGSETYTLRMLFRDEQRKVVKQITEAHAGELAALCRQVYQNEAPFVHFLKELDMPVPSCFQAAADAAVNASLMDALNADQLNVGLIHAMLAEAEKLGVNLDAVGLEFVLRRNLERRAGRFAADPLDLEPLRDFKTAAALACDMPFEAVLRTPQNLFYNVLQKTYPAYRDKQARNDGDISEWLDDFRELGAMLAVRVPA